ncbi:hypothetical protein B0H17DRAFT_1131020 [Mycena rosella]|uniref:Uncharacterized protein n=1 Tax=Mycena rosella TaxID=1033263 RepID=A0AAD7GIC2_MYCRO|nr:hypothetical protein B0H17DRAFT_1131020 [Mycena rosella]
MATLLLDFLDPVSSLFSNDELPHPHPPAAQYGYGRYAETTMLSSDDSWLSVYDSTSPTADPGGGAVRTATAERRINGAASPGHASDRFREESSNKLVSLTPGKRMFPSRLQACRKQLPRRQSLVPVRRRRRTGGMLSWDDAVVMWFRRGVLVYFWHAGSGGAAQSSTFLLPSTPFEAQRSAEESQSHRQLAAALMFEYSTDQRNIVYLLPPLPGLPLKEFHYNRDSAAAMFVTVNSAFGHRFPSGVPNVRSR